MGSFSDIISCPVCGSEAHNEVFYKTGEEFIICGECGYNRKFFIANLEDKDKAQEGEFEWIPDFKVEEIFGCGSYKLRGKARAAYECGSFIQEESEGEFLKLVEEQKDMLEHAEYTTYKNNKLTKTILIQGELETHN